MKKQTPSGRGRVCAAAIFSLLIALFAAALLTLGKHTLLGWCLAAAAFLIFFFLRQALREKRAAARLAAWAALILLLAGALAVSRPGAASSIPRLCELLP